MKKITLLMMMVVSMFTTNLFAQSGVDVMQKSLNAMGSLKSCTYHFFAQERLKGGKMSSSDVEFKIIQSPSMRIFAKAIKPQSALLVYEPAKSGEVKVKKGLKLSMKPTAGLLMKGLHQPISRAGFLQIKKILEKSLQSRPGIDPKDFVKLVGTVNYDGKDCYKIEITDPEYKILEYTVKAGESIWKIGDARAIPEYKICDLNDFDFDDVVAGKKIKIPSSYAKKTTIYVDKATNLPIYQKIEDDKGVYEIYEFKSLKTGVALTDADFQL